MKHQGKRLTTPEIEELVLRLRHPMMIGRKVEVGEVGPGDMWLVEDMARDDMKAAADLIEELEAELGLQ